MNCRKIIFKIHVVKIAIASKIRKMYTHVVFIGRKIPRYLFVLFNGPTIPPKNHNKRKFFVDYNFFL